MSNVLNIPIGEYASSQLGLTGKLSLRDGHPYCFQITLPAQVTPRLTPSASVGLQLYRRLLVRSAVTECRFNVNFSESTPATGEQKVTILRPEGGWFHECRWSFENNRFPELETV